MTGGRKGKRKQNATKWTQKKRSSSSASGLLTKNASEVNSPIPEKKLLLEKTPHHEKRSVHQENENSPLEVENNLGSESQKYVPPFSRRESVALVSDVVKSMKDSPNKEETKSPRTVKANMSLPRQKSKTKPKTKEKRFENNPGSVESQRLEVVIYLK